MQISSLSAASICGQTPLASWGVLNGPIATIRAGPLSCIGPFMFGKSAERRICGAGWIDPSLAAVATIRCWAAGASGARSATATYLPPANWPPAGAGPEGTAGELDPGGRLPPDCVGSWPGGCPAVGVAPVTGGALVVGDVPVSEGVEVAAALGVGLAVPDGRCSV